MSDYISREAVVEFIRSYRCSTDVAIHMEQHLNEIPAADVRPVVFCEDCIHCKKGKASLECEKHTYAWNNMRRWVDKDDFCKWGVKREES